MTPLERLGAALAGGPADRRAVAPVLSLYGARLTGCPLDRYYSDPAAYALGQGAVREAFSPDVLFAPFSFGGLAEAFGSEVHPHPDAPATLRRPAVAEASAWGRVALPDPGAHPRLVFLRESVARLAAEHGREVPIAAVLPAPADLPALAMGLEAWLEAVLFEPDAARRVMDDAVPLFVRLAAALHQAGAALLVVPTALTSRRLCTPELGGAFAAAQLARALPELRGPVILHHVGTPMLPTLALLAALPGVAGFALDEADDPARARALVGPRPVLLTGPSGPGLAGRPPAEVEAAARRHLEARRGDPHFALCTTGADVPWQTAPEAIHALRRAAEAAGGPP